MEDFFKSKKFKILLAILIIILVFVLRAAWSGGLAPMTSQVISTISSPFQKMSAKISSTVSDFINVFTNAKEISAENDELKKRLEDLTSKLTEYDKYKRENEHLKKFLEIKELNPQLEFETATVIGRDSHERFYSFTIDKGSLNGIEPRDTVISANGVVGIVEEVGMTYSKIITIYDVAFEMGTYVSSTRDVGVLSGTISALKDKYTVMSMLPKDTNAKAGDIILTSGYGGLYPKDLVVGEIIDIKNETHGLSKYALIKPQTDITKLNDVLVIKSFLGEQKNTDK